MRLLRPSSTPSWPRRCAAAATPPGPRELAVEAIACATSARELAWEPEPGRGRPARRRPGVGADVRRTTSTAPSARCAACAGACRPTAASGCAATPTSPWPGCSRGWPSGTATTERGEEAVGPAGRRRRAPSPPPATAAATGSACSSSARTPPTSAAPPRRCTGWRPTAPTPAARTPAAGELWAEMFVRRSRLREAERQAALLRRHALEDPLTGLGNRRSAERRLGALRLGEEPLSLAVVDVDRFKSVNDAASHTPGRRRPAPGRRPAARAQPHRRRGLPLGRRRVPRRPADGDRGRRPSWSWSGSAAAVAGADWRDLQLPEPVTVEHRRGQRPRQSTTGRRRPTPSAGGRCSTPPTCTCSPPSASGRNRVRAPGAGRPPSPPRTTTAAPPDGEADA